jgi:hypothetical protein
LKAERVAPGRRSINGTGGGEPLDSRPLVGIVPPPNPDFWKDLTMRKQLIAFALIATLVGSSCVGSYRAFNSLASWNTRATDSKWWNEVINLGLWIVPVYEILFLGDSLIFNSIEFWGGSNPISEPEKFNEGSGAKK